MARQCAVVARESKEIQRDRVGAGWAALAEGEWSAARAHFQDAVARDETPEALEGLSWAAWWVDDAEAVFDARERAYRAYRKSGSQSGAARMAIWLAADQLDFRGASAVAGGWLRRARRLLEPLDPGPDHGWLAFHEGYVAYSRGETAWVEGLAAEAEELGRRFGVPDLEMLGLALRGATLVSSGRVEEGMQTLDEAAAAALDGEATVPISGAWACCFLVGACLQTRDWERAFEWCARIAEFAERYGSRYMLAFCRAKYGAIQLCWGRWSEAEALLEAGVEDYARSRPASVGPVLAELAELRRRQGRREEALLLLGRIAGSSVVHVVRARLALDAGESQTAADLAERVLRQTPETRPLDRAPALEVLVLALVARGQVESAASQLHELREIAERVSSAPLRATADLAEGMVVAARGDHEAARLLLEDSVDRFETSGAPFETAKARTELATSLLALGRVGAAEKEAGTALETFTALGAATEAHRSRLVLDASRGNPAFRDVTPREREVLLLLADGLTNRQIAGRLVVSEHTVHRHVTNILRKLDLPTRTAAAAYAARAGLLEHPGA